MYYRIEESCPINSLDSRGSGSKRHRAIARVGGRVGGRAIAIGLWLVLLDYQCISLCYMTFILAYGSRHYTDDGQNIPEYSRIFRPAAISIMP